MWFGLVRPFIESLVMVIVPLGIIDLVHVVVNIIAVILASMMNSLNILLHSRSRILHHPRHWVLDRPWMNLIHALHHILVDVIMHAGVDPWLHAGMHIHLLHRSRLHSEPVHAWLAHHPMGHIWVPMHLLVEHVRGIVHVLTHHLVTMHLTMPKLLHHLLGIIVIIILDHGTTAIDDLTHSQLLNWLVVRAHS